MSAPLMVAIALAFDGLIVVAAAAYLADIKDGRR